MTKIERMASASTPAASDPLLSADDVMGRLSVSRTTLWRLQHDEGFPKPITFGRRLKRWRSSQIEEYLSVQGR